MAEGGSHGTRIALLPAGSRGDSQPYIALGLALRRVGYQVLVLADTDSEKYFKEWGLDAVAPRYGMESNNRTDESTIQMMTAGRLFAVLDTPSEEKKQEKARKNEEGIKAIKYHLGEFKPTLMVSNTDGLLEERKIAAQMRIPIVEVHFSPQHMPSEEFAPCHLTETVPDLETDTPTSATWAYALQNHARMVHQQEVQVLATGVSPDTMLNEQILPGHFLTPEMIFDWWFKAEDAPIPTVMAHSQHFWSYPAEWNPDGIKITGNWKICKEDQRNHASQDGNAFFGAQEDLRRTEAFIAAGDPPVYVGWGSMNVRHPLTLSYLAVKALKLAGRRGVLVRGWAQLSLEDMQGQPDAQEVLAWAQDNILVLDLAPHEWLMPQCACAVHHGGCGTCQASLSAGVPTVITPVFLDQYSNGQHMQSQKFGVVTCQLSKVTPEDLAEKVRICCSDADMQANCSRARDLMAQENGTENMVKLIGEVVSDIREGRWEAKYNARIQDQEKRRKLRLGKPIDATIAQLDRQVKQIFPEYKKFAERQLRVNMEMPDIMKSGALFYVKAASGVLVREGEGLKSLELGRLRENAILKKLEQKGNRMKVKRLRGHGPGEGWISPTVSGKDVVLQISDMGQLRPIQEALFNVQYGMSGYSP